MMIHPLDPKFSESLKELPGRLPEFYAKNSALKIEKQRGFALDESRSFHLPDDFHLPPSKKSDAHNARLLYENLRNPDGSILSPAQAGDPCLWNALAHGALAGYLRSRWDGQKPEIRFICRRTQRSLTRHGLARLWHAQHTAVAGGDPGVVETLLSHSEITERRLGNNPEIAVTIAQFAKRHNLRAKRQAGAPFTTALRELNEKAGTSHILGMGKQETKNFLEERHRNTKRTATPRSIL